MLSFFFQIPNRETGGEGPSLTISIALTWRGGFKTKNRSPKKIISDLNLKIKGVAIPNFPVFTTRSCLNIKNYKNKSQNQKYFDFLDA